MRLINIVAKWSGALLLVWAVVAAPCFGRFAYAWDSRDFHKERVGGDLIRGFVKEGTKDIFRDKENCISPDAYNALREEANKRIQRNANLYLQEIERAAVLQKKVNDLEKIVAEQRVTYLEQWQDQNNDGIEQDDEFYRVKDNTINYHPDQCGKVRFRVVVYSSEVQLVEMKLHYNDRTKKMSPHLLNIGKNAIRFNGDDTDFLDGNNECTLELIPEDGSKSYKVGEIFRK